MREGEREREGEGRNGVRERVQRRLNKREGREDIMYIIHIHLLTTFNAECH